jgi:hypothetical protein
MAAYFFASPIDVDIKLDGEETRKQVEMKVEKEKNVSCPVYYDGESISGQVRLNISSLSLFLTILSEFLGINTRPRWEESSTRRH